MSDKPENISTRHQPKGSGVNISDTLDRDVGNTGQQPADGPGKTAAEYREELGDKPDSATISHAPPSPNANPDA